MDNFNSQRGSRSGQRSSGNPGYDDSQEGSGGFNERTNRLHESYEDDERAQQTDDFGRQRPSDPRHTAQGTRSVTAEWNRDEPTWHDDREERGSRGQQQRSHGGSHFQGGSSSRGGNNRDRGEQQDGYRSGMSQQYGGFPDQRSNGNGDGDSGRGWTQQRGQNQGGSQTYSYRGGAPTSGSDRQQGPYSGKGPKGYKRSDEQICDEANQRLERNGHVDASEIEVTCADGMVTLRGVVEDRRAKREAEDCVEDIYGVKDVMNELKVDQGFFAKLFNLDGDSDTTANKHQHKKS